MAAYEKLFGLRGVVVAQVLLTHDDLEHHERHLNARNTLVTLLSRGVVPIINENDAVSFTEFKFGDNDKLSALVAALLPADLLVLLTTVEGVIENFGKRATPGRFPSSRELTPRSNGMARGTDQRDRRGRDGIQDRSGENRGPLRHSLVIASGQNKDVLANCGGRRRRHAVRGHSPTG